MTWLIGSNSPHPPPQNMEGEGRGVGWAGGGGWYSPQSHKKMRVNNLSPLVHGVAVPLPPIHHSAGRKGGVGRQWVNIVTESVHTRERNTVLTRGHLSRSSLSSKKQHATGL